MAHWVDGLLPFPRPEYAKQTESLLTDLLWRSEGSTLSVPPAAGTKTLMDCLPGLKLKGDDSKLPEPERLVPRQLRGASEKTLATAPLAETLDLTGRVNIPAGTIGPVHALLHSLSAPQARGDKSTACVPVHPSVIALQTLHGLVNKSSPANLAKAIESMGWLGGADEHGAVAREFLELFAGAADPRRGATGAIEWLLPQIAAHAWGRVPGSFGKSPPDWPVWPTLAPVTPTARVKSKVADHRQTPFAWFWGKWQSLCSPTSKWHERLPARRFVDWALCLLRTGLAFSYLWEAEFFRRVHSMVARQHAGSGAVTPSPISSLLSEGAVLATIDPPAVPASQKGIWPAVSELIARGWKARSQLIEGLSDGEELPPAATLAESVEQWVAGVDATRLSTIGASLRVTTGTANNQKEFVKYLLLPRSSDDDSVDQADFYSLAQTNSSGRHTWFRPGPEWLVVITSLLCVTPGGSCTLGELTRDLASLGIRVERSVLVGLLEEAGLSTDSPDADDALVIRSGF